MYPYPSFDQRIVRGVAATLSYQFVDQDGTAAAPGGTVTVDITRADGTALITGGSTSGSSTSPRTYSLSATNNGYTDWLTVNWKDAGTVVGTTLVEVVGRFWASLLEIRNSDDSLRSLASYPDARLLAARYEAEKEAEEIAGLAFVPRYRWLRTDGTGSVELELPDPLLRTVRSARVYSDATTYTALTAAELSSVNADPYGLATRTDFLYWPSGINNIAIGYEHGWDRPPADLLRLWFGRVRWWANRERQRLNEEAVSYLTPDLTQVTVGDDFRGYFAKLANYRLRAPVA